MSDLQKKLEAEQVNQLISKVLEIERFYVYWNNYKRKYGCDYKHIMSRDAQVNYKIPIESFLNEVCGHLELVSKQ